MLTFYKAASNGYFRIVIRYAINRKLFMHTLTLNETEVTKKEMIDASAFIIHSGFFFVVVAFYYIHLLNTSTVACSSGRKINTVIYCECVKRVYK